MEPFGFEHVFPRGTLREPLAGMARADAVALTRAERIGPEQRSQIRARIANLAPHAAWLEISHRPAALLDTEGQQQPLSALEGRPITAFCGIGNPENFRQTLSEGSWKLIDWQEFPRSLPVRPKRCEKTR